MRWEGHIECMGKMRNAYNTLVEKPEGNRPCGRHRETGLEGMDWIHLAQGRHRALVNTVMNLRVPLKRGISSLVKNYYKYTNMFNTGRFVHERKRTKQVARCKILFGSGTKYMKCLIF
jgi:hypothetical protein